MNGQFARTGAAAWLLLGLSLTGCADKVLSGSFSTTAPKSEAMTATAQSLSSMGIRVKTADVATGIIFGEATPSQTIFSASKPSRVWDAQAFVRQPRPDVREIDVTFRFPWGMVTDFDGVVPAFGNELRAKLPDATRVR